MTTQLTDDLNREAQLVEVLLAYVEAPPGRTGAGSRNCWPPTPTCARIWRNSWPATMKWSVWPPEQLAVGSRQLAGKTRRKNRFLTCLLPAANCLLPLILGN